MQPQIVIRPAHPDDYQDIARITRDSYLEAGHFDDPGHPYMLAIQNVADRAEKALVWVAERAGQIIGSVTLALAGEPFADIALDGELEFRMLVVDPAVQRSGAGRALVEAVVGHARTLSDVHAVVLTTGSGWTGARALYERMGFHRAPERDWFVPGTDIKLLVYRLGLQPPTVEAT
ncbi:GNAT family N-acetyltransferase [Arthrobacter sp. M4]|uniref:GNAT family N-acetyltransferase n=1 Tax=Arthrobacter sp. M4 TaxID=218160 RepID=UPI001CDC65BF|nr:GNAT family N-acetyltransferase [Arthrobacter sp. M4]MCA4133680.1 GNAT family N-acetyltransferase [Arthrobacter sp. M4]